MNAHLRTFSSHRILAPAAASTALLALLAGCSPPPGWTPPPQSVSTASAEVRDVPRYLDCLGQTSAYDSVNIVAQVDGQILSLPFAQGSLVKKGDTLATIDPAPYQAAHDQAQAQLNADQARLKLAQLQVDRSKALTPDNYISKHQYDTYLAQVDEMTAQIAADQATLLQAQINLGYTNIIAPVEGMVGTYMVSVGNVIKARDQALTTLQDMDPMYVDFSLAVADLPELHKYFTLSDGKLRVQVQNLTDGSLVRDGELTILGNAVDANTGTLMLRATVPNPDRFFWPNQPIRARVFLETVKNVVLVPVSAVQLNQQGQFVFIIAPPKEAGKGPTVELRPVKTGQTQDDGKVVIAEGLKGDEEVVVLGQLFLMPGAEVAIRERNGKPVTEAAAPAASATPETPKG